MDFSFGYCFVFFVTLLSHSRQYDLGTVYTYTYETTNLLSDRAGVEAPLEKKVGFQVGLVLDVETVWQNPSNGVEQILEFKVRSPKLAVKSRQSSPSEQFVHKPSKVDKLTENPFFVLRKDGQIGAVFYSSNEDTSSVNVKMGIASLFQYQTVDGNRQESDVSGSCSTSYKIKNRILVDKTKANCSISSSLPFFSHSNKVLAPDISFQAGTTFELDPSDGSIISCSSSEIHIMRMAARKTSLVEVFSSQVLRLSGKSASRSRSYDVRSSSEFVQKISSTLRTSFMQSGLIAQLEPKECIACKSLTDLVHGFRKALSPSSLGTQVSSIAFLRLLQKMRDSTTEDIRSVLMDKRNSQILPQLLDIAAATQTIAAYKAAKQAFSFCSTDVELSERFLLALSLSTHPLQFVVEDLLEISKRSINNMNLWETLLLSLASITKTYSSHSSNDQKLTQSVTHRILKGLKSCSVDHCVLAHVRALRNLQSKETLPFLLQIAKESNSKRAIYAMRALQTMPPEFIDDEVESELEIILFELKSKHDSSVRSMAMEILLRWEPKISTLIHIFQFLSKPIPGSQELKTLISSYIQDMCEKDHRMEELVRSEVLKYNLANWNSLSLGGLSSAFSRPLSNIPSSNSSFNASFTNMLEINGGILKRSNVDVYVDVGEDARMRLLSFGMFAGGLSMFGSEDDQNEAKSEEEPEEPNAGIEITLMDTQLRPFVFFTGQGELMGHVWSGTASERTTALQGLVLLHDHKQVIILQNGLNLEFLLTGVVSYDFAGQVQVSLWNRNAHSLVEVGSAVVVQGQARLDTSFVQTTLEFNTGAQTQLDFISDLDFSDDITMCLRMVQPNFDLIDTVRKFERIPGKNYVLRRYKKKSSVIPGKTFVMNKKNTELCTKMFGSTPGQ